VAALSSHPSILTGVLSFFGKSFIFIFIFILHHIHHYSAKKCEEIGVTPHKHALTGADEHGTTKDNGQRNLDPFIQVTPK